MIKTSLEFKQREHLDIARILFSNSYTSIAASFFMSCIVVYAFYEDSHSEFKFWWLLALNSVMLIRLLDTIIWYRTSQSSLSNARFSIYRYIIGTYATAILWSIYAIVIFTSTQGLELTYSVISLSGVAAGGSILLSAHKKSCLFYSTILLAPASILLILAPDKQDQLLGLLGFIFCIAMFITAKKSADFTAESVELKNKNLSLVNHMEETIELRTQQIYELSNLDPLTKLYNRTAFLKKIDQLLLNSTANKDSLAVLFVDLDNFKHVNDSMGHEIGDKLLQKTSKRLSEQCINQQLLCRWGGNEFLLALPNTTQQHAIKIAKDIIKEMSLPYFVDNNKLTIGATIGIAMFPEHGTTANTLIQLADHAMYSQKSIQPNYVEVYSEQLSKKIERENKLKNGLNHAIDNNELSIHFQPIICTKSKKIYSCEALLRWTLDGENISPVEFIPLAEQYGHIIKLGKWVLEEACLHANRWPEIQAVAVNVSVIQLQDEHFISIVENALTKSQLNSNKLHIEITESVFSADKSIILKRIKALQQKGIKVSIDDFGTEYSSLSVIQELNVNIIKIDRSFVQQLNNNGYPIITAILHIASDLDYKVVAEGIEEPEQADKLIEMGVDYLQGYLFAKPMPAQDFKKYIKEIAQTT